MPRSSKHFGQLLGLNRTKSMRHLGIWAMRIKKSLAGDAGLNHCLPGAARRKRRQLRMIAMVSRSSAAQRARSRVNAVAKASARSKVAHVHVLTAAASGTRLRRLYHVERETPSASHGPLRGPFWPYPVHPAPALRAQAGFLASDCTSYWTKSNAWYPLSCAP